jgi:hypothetical protein
LLICGVLSSLLYVGADVLAAVRYGNYHSFTSQAISELTAVGAPTKPLVSPLFIAYDVLLMAFGVAVWRSPGRKRALQLVGGLLIGIALVSLAWPPMQLRGTGDVSGDVPHIAFAGLIVLLILSAVGIGVSLFGKRFRLYSFATLLTLLVSGALTGLAGSRLAAGQPTPWLGIVERINVGVYLLWVVVLAVTLLRSEAARIQPEELPGIGQRLADRGPATLAGPGRS